MQVALGSPLDYTAIPITGTWQQIIPAIEPGKRKVIFLLTMPRNFAEIDESDNNHFVVEFAAVARTQTGAAAAQSSKTMEAHLNPGSLLADSQQRNGLSRLVNSGSGPVHRSFRGPGPPEWTARQRYCPS